ncbi:hypothetical protein Tco_0418715 [Tanacetum coccineum]
MDVNSFGLWPPKLGSLTIGRLKKPISKLGPPNFPPSLVELRLWGGSAEEDDRISVDKRYGYGYLKEFMVKRADQKEYTFMELDFPRLNLNDIEDLYF